MQNEKPSILACRIVFDGLLTQFSQKNRHGEIPLECRSHGVCSEFESAVLKQMQNRESSARERVLLEGFRLEMQEVSSSDDFVTKFLNMSHATSDYQDRSWIPPSSNHKERFFSTAKIFMGQNRFAITPEHLETQLFLHINKSYWNVNTIQSLLKKVFFIINAINDCLLFFNNNK